MAYFGAKNFFEDEVLLALQQRIFSGDLTLTWWDAKTQPVRCAPQDSRRGFTYDDCNVGPYGYGELPEFVRNNYSMAARGSELVPDLPDLGYTINRKSDVWSDNVAALYEEAKTRRWVPAVDIPWALLKSAPLADVLEMAMSQLCTFLEEVALVLMEVPSRWVFFINQEFLELKSYLCAQMIDQARHVEVFRKRALAGGQGLKRASVTGEQALKEILCADTYVECSLAANVMLNSLVLGVLRHVAAATGSVVDEKICRLAMQDTARELAYGVGHIRYHLTHQPGRSEVLHDYLDRTEHLLFGLAASRELVEPLIILSGGGIARDQTLAGARRVQRLMSLITGEYLERLQAAGLERRTRSRLATAFAPAS